MAEPWITEGRVSVRSQMRASSHTYDRQSHRKMLHGEVSITHNTHQIIKSFNRGRRSCLFAISRLRREERRERHSYDRRIINGAWNCFEGTFRLARIKHWYMFDNIFRFGKNPRWSAWMKYSSNIREILDRIVKEISLVTDGETMTGCGQWVPGLAVQLVLVNN